MYTKNYDYIYPSFFSLQFYLYSPPNVSPFQLPVDADVISFPPPCPSSPPSPLHSSKIT